MADTTTNATGPPPATAPPPGTVSGPLSTTTPDDRSITDLVSELFDETTTLLRQEVQLAKSEARQEAREVGRDVGAMVTGGAIAYTGLIALVIGLGWGLGQLIGDDGELIWLGITIAGLLVAIIGAVLLKKGMDRLADVAPPLDTTTQTLKEDKQWIERQTP